MTDYQEQETERSTQEHAKYLLFYVGDEVYGTPLLDVREVLEPIKPKPIPNTIKYFTGVINIRGQIVGVVDLRIKFGQTPREQSSTALMVFNTDGGPMAAVVDKVEAVEQIASEDIEVNPNVQTNVPLEYLIGIGKQENRLVSLIDLNRLLSAEEVKKITAAKRKA